MLTPEVVSDDEFLFGIRADRLGVFVPKDIPEEFKSPLNKWNKLFNTWFFYGLVAPVFVPKEGINSLAALKHLHVIMSSSLIEHITKEAACAYLLAE
jgi:hypothetical protein